MVVVGVGVAVFYLPLSELHTENIIYITMPSNLMDFIAFLPPLPFFSRPLSPFVLASNVAFSHP